MKKHLLNILAVLSGIAILLVVGYRGNETQVCIRLLSDSPNDIPPFKRSNPKLKKKGDRWVPDQEQNHSMVQLASISPHPTGSRLPSAYRSVEDVEFDLFALRESHPDLVHLEKVGESTGLRLPLWGVKISDNAPTKEDEPRILFTGVHHAREPIGANICLNLMRTLCSKYGIDERITRWVNEIEIWFIPIINPDGYKYILDNNLTFPWWRKNLRDNNGDGIFNPLIDGVDLNRNYDYNWREGGDGKPNSWFYRGTSPFSEKEIRAVRDLALRENFVFGISYHSYGESILFPWGNYNRPPDLDLIIDIANQMASRIRRVSGRGHYSILPLNGRVGQSSIWMYGNLRVIDYIVEVGTEYFPSSRHIPIILKEHLKGAFYLFDRLLETGIRGHVFDALTYEPLSAEVEVAALSARHVRDRQTDPEFGSFYRIVNPGSFTLIVKSDGYYPKIIDEVTVEKGQFVDLNVGLYRKDFHPTNGNPANGNN